MVHISTAQSSEVSGQETAVSASALDPEFKAKWLVALRSDEFTQARDTIGNARRKNLCCLGVGAFVANPTMGLHTTGCALEELAKHGLVAYCGEKYSPAVRRLIELNDRDRAPFSVIADHIEANL